ncbi:MAG: NCS2 family permease [Clostridia bacterium]|nr:NCS2 family permease [Clostridia bacterium]
MENNKTAKEKSGFLGKVDSFFGVTARGSSIRTELIAGIVTFLAMAYILTLNPNIILGSFGPISTRPVIWNSVFIATALGAVVGTLLMAFLAKMPLAQASGLGLNTMVNGLIGGSLIGFSISFGASMLLVFISGVMFLALSIFKLNGKSLREMIFDAIPVQVRSAISVGIGLFIAFIGLWLSGIIIDPRSVNPFDTNPLDIVKFSSWDKATLANPIVCIVGFVVIAILAHFKVKAAVIIGILVATLVGIPLGVTQWSGESWAFWEHFETFFSLNAAEGGTFFTAFTDINFNGAPLVSCIVVVITFCMIDMFDTMGTVVGCCAPVGLVDDNGKPLSYDGIMKADSIATCAGALFGTSTVTTFVESGSGVAAGGRTGLTALTTATLFFLSIFLLPLFASIPGAAVDAALVYVGCLMLKGAKDIKVDSVKEFVPAFLTIAMMPLAYSITDGIGLGILSYVAITLVDYIVRAIKYAFDKKEKPVWDMSIILIIIAVLFLVYFLVPTTF